MITAWKAINILAERAYDNRKQLKQARRQRRTEFVDIYGVPMPMPFVKEENGENIYETRLYVSLDLEYWERFQFKLEVECGDNTIDPDDFKFLIGESDPIDASVKPIDISAYLESQNGIWIDGSGYYPADEIVDETDEDDEEEVADEAGYFFDILDACSLLWAEGESDTGKKTLVNEITRAGTKIVQVKCPIECDVTFIPFIKYSTINR